MDKYLDYYDPTVADNYSKQFTVGEEEVILRIYDTAGQDDFSAVRDQYIMLADGVICVYSVLDASSFLEIKHLHQRLSAHIPNAPVLLVGNKIDEEEKRQISTFEGKELSDRFGWRFIEISAKLKKNVNETFIEIVNAIRDAKAGGETEETTVKRNRRRKMYKQCNLF